MPTLTQGGVVSSVAPDHEKGLAESIREIAAHLQHAAEIALVAADSDEPERGLKYLAEGHASTGPDIAALLRRFAGLLPLLFVVT